jgi:hypothetical protein
LDVSAALEIEQDEFEKLLGNMLELGNIFGQEITLSMLFPQPDKCLQCILAFSRHHRDNLRRLIREGKRTDHRKGAAKLHSANTIHGQL